MFNIIFPAFNICLPRLRTFPHLFFFSSFSSCIFYNQRGKEEIMELVWLRNFSKMRFYNSRREDLETRHWSRQQSRHWFRHCLEWGLAWLKSARGGQGRIGIANHNKEYFVTCSIRQDVWLPGAERFYQLDDETGQRLLSFLLPDQQN